MVVNDKEFDIDELTKDYDFSKNMLKKRDNGMLLSDEQVEVLDRYNINYNKYLKIEQLIYEIEECLNNGEGSDDLEWLSRELAERNYYQNTNK